MTLQARIPPWVTPAPAAIADFHRITYARNRQNPIDETNGGYLAAVIWVTGDGHAPITAAPGQPVTIELAEMEMACASHVRRADPRAAGVADGLAWLVGLLSNPPIDLPRRNPDGSVLTAAQLVAEAEAAAPLRWEPEERRDQEAKARRTAARWRALADLAASV